MRKKNNKVSTDNVTNIGGYKNLTTNPDDPRLSHGIDDEPAGMAGAYLVLSEEERSKGYVRPVRRSYVHVGPTGPTNPLRPLTEEENNSYGEYYIGFEPFGDESSKAGKFWTQDQIDAVNRGGCGTVTSMSLPLAETYARNPSFYGATFCVGCNKHLEVGKYGEFIWDGTDERVGT